MRVLAFAAAALVAAGTSRTPAVSCDRSRGAVAVAFLSVDQPAPADTMITAAVCLTPSATRGDVGSYHGELLYDTVAARIASVQHPNDGIRVENPGLPGKIGFVGASISGFAPGVLLTIRFRLTVAGRVPRLVLHLMELNDVAGASLTKALRVDSVPGARSSPATKAPGPDSCAHGVPRIRAIAPAEVDITSGDQTPIVISGCAFAATNILRIGPVTFNNVPSTENGTSIRFVVPLVIRSTGEVPPRRMPTGGMDVTITTSVASSNRMTLTLK